MLCLNNNNNVLRVRDLANAKEMGGILVVVTAVLASVCTRSLPGFLCALIPTGGWSGKVEHRELANSLDKGSAKKSASQRTICG